MLFRSSKPNSCFTIPKINQSASPQLRQLYLFLPQVQRHSSQASGNYVRWLTWRLWVEQRSPDPCCITTAKIYTLMHTFSLLKRVMFYFHHCLLPCRSRSPAVVRSAMYVGGPIITHLILRNSIFSARGYLNKFEERKTREVVCRVEPRGAWSW